MQARATQPTPDCPGLDDCDAAAPLIERLERVESGVRMLAAGHQTLANQMAEVTVVLREQDRRIDASAESLARIEARSDESAELLRDIRDGLITARTSAKLVRWLAPTLIALAAVVATVKGWILAAWWHK